MPEGWQGSMPGLHDMSDSFIGVAEALHGSLLYEILGLMVNHLAEYTD